MLILFWNLSAKCQYTDTTKARAYENAAWKAYQESYFKKSIRLFDSAIFYGSTWKSLYAIKAEAHWFIGEFADAAKAYKKRIALSGEDLLKVGAFVKLGMLYDKAGMPKESKKQYISAIKLWENGYIPLKQFRHYEETEYLYALAFLGNRKKLKKVLEEYAKKHPYENQLELLNKSKQELLKIHFEEYQLPSHIKPLEE